jgi:hypothetical protein
MIDGLSTDSSQPAVRRPMMTLCFGAASADDWGKATMSVSVETGPAPNVDVAKVVLSLNETSPGIEIGDTGSISLGYADSSIDTVFTGQIEDVTYTLQGTMCITASNGSAKVSKLRVNQSFEQQTAGEIVADLAKKAGVDTKTVEDGAAFPYFVVDDRKTAYRHIAELARKSGYLAFFGVEDVLNFAPFVAGRAVQTFTYGKDIISLQMSKRAPIWGAVSVIGEGAAGSLGEEAWSWIVKDPASVTSSAGEGDLERILPVPALRSSDAAKSAADGIAGAETLLQIIGKLLVPGAPVVAVGCAVEIKEAPNEELNGLCLVRDVRHYFSKQEGFSTIISFCKACGGGLGGFA